MGIMNELALIKKQEILNAEVCWKALKLYRSMKKAGLDYNNALVRGLKTSVSLEDNKGEFIRVNLGAIFAYYWFDTKSYTIELNPQGCGGAEVIVCESLKEFKKVINTLSAETLYEEFYVKCEYFMKNLEFYVKCDFRA